MPTLDLGGNDLVCKSLRIGANGPGETGTDLVPSDLQFAGDTSVDGDLTVNGPTGTGVDSAGLLAFTTDETTIVALDQIGRITFTAPDEASGTDAVALAAFITAEATDTFSATVNSTDLVIGLGTSGAAAETARFVSTGGLTITGALTSAGATFGASAVNRTGRIGVVPICGNAKVGATAGWVITGGTNICHATLPAGQTNSTLVVPITGLHIGDTLTGVGVTGQVESAGNNVTLVLSVRKLTTAAADNTDAELATDNVGTLVADTQITSANLGVTGLTETLAEGETVYVLLTGTTATATDIDLTGLVVTYTQV